MQITKKMINQATSPRKMDATYRVLLDMCKTYPDHTDEGGIIAKVLIIGRTYAAALERRQNKKEASDYFYENVVVNHLKDSRLDEYFSELRKLTEINCESIPLILEVHDHLNQTFKKIAGSNKISLASKYLHLHFPEFYFISDGRAKTGLSQDKLNIQFKSPAHTELERSDYKNFFYRCLELQSRVKRDHAIQLSPREIDNLLLDVFEGRY